MLVGFVGDVEVVVVRVFYEFGWDLAQIDVDFLVAEIRSCERRFRKNRTDVQ